MIRLSRGLTMSMVDMRREITDAIDHIRRTANMLDEKLAVYPELAQFRVDYFKETELQALELEDRLMEFDMECRKLGVDV